MQQNKNGHYSQGIPMESFNYILEHFHWKMAFVETEAFCIRCVNYMCGSYTCVYNCL